MDTKAAQKIGIGEKLAFFLANVGNIPVMNLIGSYLLIFYTDVVGLNAVAIGTLFLLTRILDGINDPLVGFVIDRIPRKKNGKFKTILFVGAIACSVNFALLWYGPALAPAALKMAVAYITYILIGITFDIMDISLNSMIPVMTADMKERNSLSTLKGAGYMLGTVIVSIGAPLIIDAFSDKINGYFLLIGIATVIILLFSVIGAIGIKERIGAINDENYTLKQLFSFLLLRPVMVTFFSQLLFIGGRAIHTASELFFATYIIGDIKVIAICAAVTLVGMIPAVLFSGILIEKLGKKIVYSLGIIIYAAGILICFIKPTSITLMYGAYVILGLGAGMAMVLMYGIQADNIDYVEYSKGLRAEGVLSALQSLVAKLGGALGGSLPAYILAWSGYVANVEQTVRAKGGIMVSTLIIPAVFMIAAAFLFLFYYKLDKTKLNEMQDELARLRNQDI